MTDRQRLITRDYVAQYPDPITVGAGAPVRVEREDPEFPGWWWCIADDDRAGWVHVELLAPSPTPGGSAHLRVAYSALELTVDRGTIVSVVDERGGWLLVSTPDGRQGWLPASHVSQADPPSH